MRVQQAPYVVQVELTEGCNRGCDFCGLNGMRKHGKGPFYHMQMETAQRIVDEVSRLGWKPRFLFAMHGEPTLNEHCTEIIKLFSKAFPRSHISMFTNGVGIVKGKVTIKQLREAGVTNLMIELYEPGDDGHKIKARFDKKGIPYEVLGDGTPMFSNKLNWRVLFAPPLTEGEIKTHTLCNHCGAALPKNDSCAGKRCTRPFREISFRYDGSIAICCNDFRGEYPIGNINDTPLDELWNGKRFNAARIMLYAGERTFTPCQGCDAVSFRVGLLPDKYGKETLPEPTEKVRAYARSVSKKNEPLCGDNWTNRPWEEE